jgi:two-component system, LytTR family, sensor kinase
MHEQHPNYFKELFLQALMGLLVTHLMRNTIQSTKLLQKDIGIQALYLFGITLVFTLLYATSNIYAEKLLGIQNPAINEVPFTYVFIRTCFAAFVFLTIWNLLYFTYHYIARSRKENLDKIRLEALVKELQLKTIKAHINPHFIFNALNSIRSLVDENPARARTAITELSNILRSSMATDKIETVPLEKELAIVKDYLALEQIRFEERLHVQMDIDKDTLSQPVPYMMLQTLVENAVKHGISKEMDGGHIRITSDFIDDHHELIIRNTGHLNGSAGNEGFGLSSTRNRLNLLFGSQAGFEIKDIGEKEVEAKVILPVAV